MSARRHATIPKAPGEWVGAANRPRGHERENMSLYVDDPTVDELILTIINDGNGDQCGMTYRARCEAAKRPDGGLLLYRAAARHYNRHASRVYGTRHATLAQCSAAGDYLARYYAEHLAEMAQ